MLLYATRWKNMIILRDGAKIPEKRIWLWRNALKEQALEAEAWRAWPKGETESRGSVVQDLRIRGGVETRDA